MTFQEDRAEGSELAATRLAQDPRIEQAKELLLSAVADAQHSIQGIRSATPSLKISYDEMLARFAELRGAKLWYPYLGSGIGNGPLVELMDGSVKYDFISGIGVHYLGHSDRELIASSIDAAVSNTIMQGHLQQNEDSLQLSELLVKASGLPHCFLTSSGAMANENALKIALQKNSPASRILSFERAFAGRTLALSQVTDKPAFRVGLPSILSVDYVPFYDPEHPEESTNAAVSVLKKHLARYPKKHAAMIFELIQGEGGAYPGSHDFFTPLMRLLKEHGVAVFVDEVQTFGRTERLFAFQHFGLEEFVDIVSVGKLSQVCATLFTDDYKPQPGLLSQTFTGSTAVIRAGLVIINALLNDGFLGPEGKNSQLHRHFAKGLLALSKKFPDRVKGPFGIGTMIAFTPFGGDNDRVYRYSHELFDAGVMGFIAGANPTRIRFLIPAGAITTKDIDEVLLIIENTLR